MVLLNYMKLRNILLAFLFFFMSFSYAQSSLEVQNKILKQFDYLIPKTSSFASWTMYELQFNGGKEKNYIFSYILSNKYKRDKHAGSGVIIVKKGKNNTFKLMGHIPSKSKNIYAFNTYANKVFYLNEYDARTNYQTVTKELKYVRKGDKIVSL